MQMSDILSCKKVQSVAFISAFQGNMDLICEYKTVQQFNTTQKKNNNNKKTTQITLQFFSPVKTMPRSDYQLLYWQHFPVLSTVLTAIKNSALIEIIKHSKVPYSGSPQARIQTT